MPDPDQHEVTRILIDLKQGSPQAREVADRLFEAVQGELRRVAGRLMKDERKGHTLQATALVNEAYLRLIDRTHVDWQNRAHFFGIAARAMRQILVDHARERAAAKRGGGWQRVTLDGQIGDSGDQEIEILDLDRALTRLGELDERMARVVEHRVFAGMSVEEVAHVLGVSVRTVHNDWRVARMWLRRELTRGDTD